MNNDKIKIDDSFFSNLGVMEQRQLLGTATHNFFGLEMQQHPLSPFKLNQLCRAIQPDTIIEVGCLHGGLSFLFALYAVLHKKKFYCYDIEDTGYHVPLLVKLFDCFQKKDVINNKDNVEEVKKLISGPGRTLLICDAGKALEFNIYADSLKVGDFVLTHDFSPTAETFKNDIQGRIWNWHENWYERIEDAVVRNNIVHTTYFYDVVWSCGWKMPKEELKEKITEELKVS